MALHTVISSVKARKVGKELVVAEGFDAVKQHFDEQFEKTWA